MDRLAELRERRALTLRELAEMSGVAADTINQIELGHRKPRPSTLRKLARALGVNVEDFYMEPTRPKVKAPPPSREWAAAAPEEEFNSWVETANLHDTLTLNRNLSTIAASETAGTDEHRRLLRRLSKVAEHFMEFGPFQLVETSRSRRATATRENEERQEGQAAG